jgi:hypothetical protein
MPWCVIVQAEYSQHPTRFLDRVRTGKFSRPVSDKRELDDRSHTNPQAHQQLISARLNWDRVRDYAGRLSGRTHWRGNTQTKAYEDLGPKQSR